MSTPVTHLGSHLKEYTQIKNKQLAYLVVFLTPGLLIVDHIHFQYNGFLFGVMCWSLYYLKKVNCFVRLMTLLMIV